MAHVYILRSLKDGGYYYGSTGDLQARLKAHDAGRVRSTKSRRPFVLHYHEECDSLRLARQRENFFKSIKGYKWLRESGIIREA